MLPDKTTSMPGQWKATILDRLIKEHNGCMEFTDASPHYNTLLALIHDGYLIRDGNNINVTIAGYYALAAYYLLCQLPTDSQHILHLMTYVLADQE